MLYAFADKGPNVSLQYRNPCNYGPMAIYDSSEPDFQGAAKEDQAAKEEQVLWILTRSPGMVDGHRLSNGSLAHSMWIADIAKMPSGAWLSSTLTITRQS